MLAAAAVSTCIIDMGGGTVFIVFAALHLSKNTSVPAATWLFVGSVVCE